ncbi:Myb-like DNA-binding protein, REB1 [Rhodotorula toruloides]|uniref:BY PROTMAP: gi/472585944/gb/EMS23486.1/ Myb-like DNA-binding protein, REB1 [Rhodosporidium toruloides NP11] gi/647395658/emb/CDR37256.1/ RHTO0S02e12618g1_1 [Rhodosporidium toruloides] n=1 Tax=Rhodotorula toruloides TaxID=5286 RepID=A0A0K3CHP6_RHOTO|nr:Myb-like DNA-binding protein, REB1 [Rhodotorula toruloides]
MGKRHRSDAATDAATAVEPADEGARKAAKKQRKEEKKRKRLDKDAAAAEAGTAGTAEADQAGLNGAQGEQDAGDENTSDDRAARKAAKAARKEAKKAAKAAGNNAPPEQPAGSGIDSEQVEKKKRKKDRKGKGKEVEATPEQDETATVSPVKEKRKKSKKRQAAADAAIQAGIDPSLASLLDDRDFPVYPGAFNGGVSNAGASTSAAAAAAEPEVAYPNFNGSFGYFSAVQPHHYSQTLQDIPVDPSLIEVRAPNHASTSASLPDPQDPIVSPTVEHEVRLEDGEKRKAKDDKGKKKKADAPPKKRKRAAAGEEGTTRTKRKKTQGTLGAEGVEAAKGDFTEQLVTKWLRAADLKKLADEHGATYKSGKFSKAEDDTLRAAIEAFRAEQDLTQDELATLFNTKGDPKAKPNGVVAPQNEIWTRLARSLGNRPLSAVYTHVKLWYPVGGKDEAEKKGEKWTKEEDEALARAVKELGNSWVRIGQELGRSRDSCKDRWTKQLQNGAVLKAGTGAGGAAPATVKKQGKWSEEEEEQLRKLYKKHGAQWTVISAEMGGARTSTQCRTKWTDYLQRREEKKENEPAADKGDAANLWHWPKEGSARLVHAIAALDPKDKTDIDYKKVSDPEIAPQGAKNLRDRFRRLMESAEKSVREEKGMDEEDEVAFADTMAQLLEEYPTPTSLPGKRKRRSKADKADGSQKRTRSKPAGSRKVKSKELVSSSDEESSDDEEA